MTVHGKIKTEWAACVVAPAGDVIVCVRQNGSSRCLGFADVEQLHQAMASRQLTAQHWVTVVSQSDYINKSLVLPTSDLEEALKMVEFELPSLVPLAKEEMVCGCHLSRQGPASTTLQVYVLRTKALEQRLAPYRRIGIEPEVILADTLALQSWFEAVGPSQGGPSISALMDEDRCIILCSEKDRLQAASQVSCSSQGAAEVARQIWDCGQVEGRSEGHPHCEFRLAGIKEPSLAVERHLRSMSEGRIDAPSIRFLPGARETYCPWNGQAALPSGLDALCAEATGALEAAIRGTYPYANLVPAGTFARRDKRARWLNAFVTAILVILCLLLTWTLLQVMNWRTRQQVSKIEAQVAALQKVAGDVEGKRVLIRAVERQFSGRGLVLGVMEELYRYIPDSISIHHVLIESRSGGPLVTIRGQAPTAAAWDLPQAVQKARLLKAMQVDDIGEETSQSGGTSCAQFKMHCILPEP